MKEVQNPSRSGDHARPTPKWSPDATHCLPSDASRPHSTQLARPRLRCQLAPALAAPNCRIPAATATCKLAGSPPYRRQLAPTHHHLPNAASLPAATAKFRNKTHFQCPKVPTWAVPDLACRH